MNTNGSRLLATLLTGTLTLAEAAHAAPGCSIVSLTGLNFGAYDSLSAEPVTTAGSLSLCCEGLGPTEFVSIGISRGAAAEGSWGRALSSGTDRLFYQLYTEPALMRVWGDGFDGTEPYGPVRPSSGQCMAIPIYGYMPAQQAVRPGMYSDSLVLTLSF